LPNVHIQDHPRIIDNVAEVHFVDISAGTSHCLALDDKGHVYSWGTHEYNVLGRSPNTPSLLPTKLDLTNITSIACGSFHSLVVDRFGQVYSWGLNHMLQCGLVEKADNGHYIEAPDSIVLPTLLPYFKKSTIKDNMRFLEEEACKQSLQGGSEMDKKTKAFSVKRPDVVSVAAGQYHSIAVMDDDTLRVWGRCDSGQLGLMFYPNYTYPASFKSKKNDQVYAIGHPLSSLWQCSEKIKKVVCGSSHTMVISTSGKIWGFGQSAFHQLGIYQEEDIILPSPIESIMDKGRIIEAAAGDRHSLFVVAEDEVRHQIRLLD
jgi:alpha-tubulin suppressor-like RCC1 family protein